MYTTEEIKVANKTSRSGGAVGSSAITPEYIKLFCHRSASILDFGAGKTAEHTASLRDLGFDDVTAHDFGDNVNEEFHNPKALARKYDIVYASNVLNVQSSVNMLGTTLETLAKCMKKKGFLLVNYPVSPRKGVMEQVDPEQLKAFLESFFIVVDRVGGTRTAPLFKCSGVRGIGERLDDIIDAEYIDDDWTPEGEDDLATIEANLEALEKGLVTDDPFANRK